MQLFLAALGLALSAPGPRLVAVYVGTYTVGSESKGIYRFALDLSNGRLTPAGEATPAVNPSFLALHPNGRVLYAVNEAREIDGHPGGGVSAFAIEPGGTLRFLNRESSRGAGPCHLSLDPTGRHVLVANYDDGTASVLAVAADGRLGSSTAFVQHRGSSLHPTRQAGPHAHSIYLDAGTAWVADLGLDSVLAYGFDEERGTLTPQPQAALALAPGSGPRHLAFGANGRYAYVINELSASLTVFGYADGARKEIQTLRTLPDEFRGANTTAEVAASPDGRFLYGSNRGHDSIAIFAIDPASGRLTLVGHQPTLGKTPRNFAIDPTGAFLIAANQDSNTLVVFRVDRAGGRLTPVGEPVSVPRPVCVLMKRAD